MNANSPSIRQDIFQAIADPSRRTIIALLALQAMTPNAIAANFLTTRQAVSKHLRVLTECDLVKQEQQGREIYYSLQIEKMKEIDSWLSQYRTLWGNPVRSIGQCIINNKKAEKMNNMLQFDFTVDKSAKQSIPPGSLALNFHWYGTRLPGLRYWTNGCHRNP